MLLPLSAQAQWQIDRVFSDNMLLQRDQPVCVRGMAAPGQRVTVSLGKEAQSAVTKKDSSLYACLHQIYDQNCVPSGPLPVKATYSLRKVPVSFRFTANGLETTDGSPVKGFSLDGKNEVEAFLKGNDIVIQTDMKPGFVHYGWKPFSDGNLSIRKNSRHQRSG